MKMLGDSTTHVAAMAPNLSSPVFVNPKVRYFVWFVVLTIIDGLQTSRIVAQFGSIAEANPLMRLALEHASISGLWWVKAVAITAVVLAIGRIRANVLLVVVVLMALVVTNNLVQMVIAYGAY